jgi:hypothetical protein
MFDTIGKRRSEERRLVPFVLSLLANGSVVGGLVLFGADRIEDVVAEVPLPIVYYAHAPPEAPAALPAAAPAASATKRAAARRAPTAVAEQPAEAAPAVAPESGLDAISGVDITSTTGGGEGGGVALGTGGGTGGPRAVHWADVAVKYRARPKMPEAARVLSFSEESCNVRFFIDEKGKPYDIRLETCPAIFRDSALEAAWQWRFYPMKDEGVPIKAQFVLSIKYRLR